MNFIKLHDRNNKDIRINMDLIESYGVITTERYDCSEDLIGLTYMVPSGCRNDEDCYVVTEMPEEIDELADAGKKMTVLFE